MELVGARVVHKANSHILKLFKLICTFFNKEVGHAGGYPCFNKSNDVSLPEWLIKIKLFNFVRTNSIFIAVRLPTGSQVHIIDACIYAFFENHCVEYWGTGIYDKEWSVFLDYF